MITNFYLLKIKKNSKEIILGRIFYMGLREGETTLIWVYAEWFNFHLGIQEYQKVENHST